MDTTMSKLSRRTLFVGAAASLVSAVPAAVPAASAAPASVRRVFYIDVGTTPPIEISRQLDQLQARFSRR